MNRAATFSIRIPIQEAPIVSTDDQLENIIAGLKKHCNIDLSHSSRDSFLRDLGTALAQHDAAMDEEGGDAPEGAAEGVSDEHEEQERLAKQIADSGLAQYSLESRPILDEARHAKEFVDNQIRRGVIGLQKKRT